MPQSPQYPPGKAPQFLTMSYRNALFQGFFSTASQNREGFGLIFTTDTHLVMGSTWKQDLANDATFLYYNHAHYVYGFWQDGVPNGFNAVRMGHIVVFGWYEQGLLKGRMLVVYEKYGIGAVVQVGGNGGNGQIVEIAKGDIFSDEQLNEFIRMCNWQQFQQNWKTLIKFLSANLVSQTVKFQSSNSKSEQPKLRLINQCHFRYGFDQGIAIVFDDEYNIVSAGVHKKANLKSLGIRFTKENFVEQGNFDNSNQVYAFNYGKRPENKVGKIYASYLLKSVQFVNKYIVNPGKGIIGYLQELVKSNVFRIMLAGQITTRKIDLSYESPRPNQVGKNGESIDQGDINEEHHNEKEPYNEEKALRKYEQIQKLKELKEERKRLELYKKQIYQSIGKRSRTDQHEGEERGTINKNPSQKNDIKIQPETMRPIITKPPVQLVTRQSHYNNKNLASKNKNRSPIFTPDKESKSGSPSNLSPFRERMKLKIFKQQHEIRNKKYIYAPIEEQLYPKHAELANARKYNSPHEELDISKSITNQNREHVIPISVANEPGQAQQKYGSNYSYNNRQAAFKQRNNMLKSKEVQRAAKIAQPLATSNEKKVINSTDKNGPIMSFRDPYGENQSKRRQRQLKQEANYTNTNVPNIVINSPYKGRSPHKKNTQQPKNSQDHRKNNVYLRTNTQPVIEAQTSKQKGVKGQTYLQKYNKQKQRKVSPSPAKETDLESKKMSKTIKSFNSNNRIYEKIQSPQRKMVSQQQPMTSPAKGKVKTTNSTYINTGSKPGQLQYNDATFYDMKNADRNVNQTTPIKRKYQYVYE